MSFLGKIVHGVINAATAPVRMVIDGVKMAGNALLIAKDLVTGDKAGLAKDKHDLWDATKGVAFAGLETVSGPFAPAVGIFEANMREGLV